MIRLTPAMKKQGQEPREKLLMDTLGALPEGWTLEPLCTGCFLLKSPDGLMVTIDFDVRGYRAGNTTTGRTITSTKYQGRGWRERLIRDAIRWLEDLQRSRT